MWKSSRRAMLVTALALFSIPPFAGASSQYDECMKDKSTNLEWSQCGSAEIARQEARLAAAWTKALSCFSSRKTEEEASRIKEQFIDAQNLWIKWKNVACDFYTRPGSGRESQVVDFPICEAEIISQRATWLENFAKQESQGEAVGCD